MIILSALGIPRNLVLEDYLLSNQYHKDTIEEVLSENQEDIENHPVLGELLSMRTGVTEKIGRTVLEEMHTRYGSIEDYLEKEFHLYPKELETLRNTYLE